MTRPLASPVLILGAHSDIGRALARAYAAAGCALILAARQAPEDDAADIALRSGGAVRAVAFDVTGDPEAFFDGLGEVPGTVIMVAGLLGDQAQSAAEDGAAALVMETNYTGPARFLLAAARRMAGRADGCIIGISSVAGERGRGSNFIYGSAKAGLTALLSGLRNAHARGGPHVITVKPGFVATQMTAGMDLPPLLTAQPAEVARDILRAHRARADVVYSRGRWRWIMLAVRLIPERLFKRLSL